MRWCLQVRDSDVSGICGRAEWRIKDNAWVLHDQTLAYYGVRYRLVIDGVTVAEDVCEPPVVDLQRNWASVRFSDLPNIGPVLRTLSTDNYDDSADYGWLSDAY